MLNAHVEDIRTFVAVADAGAVSTAARELHLTQSAATRASATITASPQLKELHRD